MVCLGITFRCNHSSGISYLLSGLVIVAILAGLKILCYGIYRLLNRRDSSFYDSGDGVEMQLPSSTPWQPPRSYMIRRTLPESKLVILAGDDQVSSVAQPVNLLRTKWVLIHHSRIRPTTIFLLYVYSSIGCYFRVDVTNKVCLYLLLDKVMKVY